MPRRDTNWLRAPLDRVAHHLFFGAVSKVKREEAMKTYDLVPKSSVFSSENTQAKSKQVNLEALPKAAPAG